VKSFSGDITDAKDVAAAVSGVQAVIHLAAVLHIVNPPEHLRDRYWRVNVEGTKTVVDAAVDAGISRILFFSTIAVYGNTRGQIVDERTPPQPDTFYGQTKLEAERIVLGAKNSAGDHIGTVLRLGAIYGSRIKGNYQHLLTALDRGIFLPIGKGRNRRTMIYEKDAAAAATLALAHPAARGRLYNVSDGKHHLMKEILSTMCQALGRTPPRLSLPVAPVRFLAGFFEETAKIGGWRPPFTRETIDKYLEDVAVDSGLIRKELGFEAKFDLLAGWQNTVREIRRADKGIKP